jgi:hypothetical protein
MNKMFSLINIQLRSIIQQEETKNLKIINLQYPLKTNFNKIVIKKTEKFSVFFIDLASVHKLKLIPN